MATMAMLSVSANAQVPPRRVTSASSMASRRRAPAVIMAASGGKQYSPGTSGAARLCGEPFQAVDRDGHRFGVVAGVHFGVDAVGGRVDGGLERLAHPAPRLLVEAGIVLGLDAQLDQALEVVVLSRVDRAGTGDPQRPQIGEHARRRGGSARRERCVAAFSSGCRILAAAMSASIHGTGSLSVTGVTAMLSDCAGGVVAAADGQDVLVAWGDPAEHVEIAPRRRVVELVEGEVVDPRLDLGRVDLGDLDPLAGEVVPRADQAAHGGVVGRGSRPTRSAPAVQRMWHSARPP